MILYRYMPKEFADKMVDKGEVRISRSSKFRDGAGMMEGQKDDEHRKSILVGASDIKLVEDPRYDPRMGSEIIKLVDEDQKYKIDTSVNIPYWVLCLSVDLRLYLFDEFNSDAVVAIWDIDEFIHRITLNSKFLVPSPEYEMKMFYQPVHYLSELIAFGGYSTITINPFFTKPERYKNQKEYRFVWYPSYGDKLHEFLQLDSLKNIAWVISKEDVENGTVREMMCDHCCPKKILLACHNSLI